MKAIISLPKIDFNNIGEKNCPVEIEVKLKQQDEKEFFSVCGGIWNHIHTDYCCCGQCLDILVEYYQDNDLFRQIYRLWKLYHLNDMHAGTEKQEQAIEHAKKNGLLGKNADYCAVCDYLKSIDLYEDTCNGMPYIYGTAWLYQPIPDDDLNLIKSIIKEYGGEEND